MFYFSAVQISCVYFSVVEISCVYFSAVEIQYLSQFPLQNYLHSSARKPLKSFMFSLQKDTSFSDSKNEEDTQFTISLQLQYAYVFLEHNVLVIATSENLMSWSMDPQTLGVVTRSVICSLLIFGLTFASHAALKKDSRESNQIMNISRCLTGRH